MKIPLTTLDDTLELAVALATTVQETKTRIILLRGELGTGKTTLTKFFVKQFPGGDEAETTSPSFTICNIYSTLPAIHHYDLYRLMPGIMDEGLVESFEALKTITIVEWSEHLAEKDLPEKALVCSLYVDEKTNKRWAELSFTDKEAAHSFTFMNLITSAVI